MLEASLQEKQSDWLLSGSEVYEEVRRALDSAVQVELARARDDVMKRADALDAALRLRHDVLAVDGFDRRAVDELQGVLDRHLADVRSRGE